MLLHITNDYSGSTVYKNLVRELDCIGVEQIVYNPIREENRVGQNKIDFKQADSKIFYSHILNSHTDRIFYKKKIYKILEDIESKIDLSKISFIHAHTWYSDGGVAYLLSRKYNIPYIVAIRNTDLNIFQKYFIHERVFGKKILLNSSKVITISEVYKNRILNHTSLSSIINDINKKLIVIPNGVDPFWIENANLNGIKNQPSNIFKLLYVGKFDKGKNVLNLVKAVKNLNISSEYNCYLTLVGGGGNDEVNVLKEINESEEICFKGKVFDKKELLEIYRDNDFFLMPSKAETFGLVYVEAMLQGLPILYTNNEGIDGAYLENIGEKVYLLDQIEIENKLKIMINNHLKYNLPIEKMLINHNWKSITKRYLNIYNEK